MNGEFYSLPPDYSPSDLVGPSSIIGDRENTIAPVISLPVLLVVASELLGLNSKASHNVGASFVERQESGY